MEALGWRRFSLTRAINAASSAELIGIWRRAMHSMSLHAAHPYGVLTEVFNTAGGLIKSMAALAA